MLMIICVVIFVIPISLAITLRFVKTSPSFDRLFTTPAGRVFKYRYDQCKKKYCDREILRDIGNRYFFETAGYNSNNILESFSVRILTFANREPPVSDSMYEQDIHYGYCAADSYYKGHGLRALYTTTLQDYASAIDLEASALCFSHAEVKRPSLKAIRFGWYSLEEMPKKIALYGVYDGDPLVHKLIGEYQMTRDESVGGYEFSVLKFKQYPSYDYYIVKLIEGGAQNRLILRVLEPLFDIVSPYQPNELVLLADKISKLKPYGEGLFEVKVTSQQCKQKAIISSLAESVTWHCGNYAYYFVSKLPKSFQYRLYGLTTYDGRIHAVVEVQDKDRVRVVDPTLGVVYPCSMNALIEGSCDYDAAQYITKPHPAMSDYFGAGFFYGAKVMYSYASEDELNNLYCYSHN
jgi:hypothetical protein